MKLNALLGACLLTLPATAMAAGMPQLDFGNPLTISQVVWGAIIFVVLYLMLARGGLPQVESVLAERAASISTELEAARAAKAKADIDMAEAQVARDRAHAEAQGAINAAVNEAKEAAARQAESLNAQLDKQLADSEAQIAQARTAAMSAVRQVATETANLVVTRLAGAPPNPARLENAVGSVMAARGIG
jgi:F-type H+-transporting ATPase subunit b